MKPLSSIVALSPGCVKERKTKVHLGDHQAEGTCIKSVTAKVNGKI